MKKSTQGIIGLILIIGAALAILIGGRWMLYADIDITTAITTAQAILIGSIVIAITNKRKGK